MVGLGMHVIWINLLLRWPSIIWKEHIKEHYVEFKAQISLLLYVSDNTKEHKYNVSKYISELTPNHPAAWITNSFSYLMINWIVLNISHRAKKMRSMFSIHSPNHEKYCFSQLCFRWWLGMHARTSHGPVLTCLKNVWVNAGKKGLRWDTVDPCKHYQYIQSTIRLYSKGGEKPSMGLWAPRLFQYSTSVANRCSEGGR